MIQIHTKHPAHWTYKSPQNKCTYNKCEQQWSKTDHFNEIKVTAQYVDFSIKVQKFDKPMYTTCVTSGKLYISYNLSLTCML